MLSSFLPFLILAHVEVCVIYTYTHVFVCMWAHMSVYIHLCGCEYGSWGWCGCLPWLLSTFWFIETGCLTKPTSLPFHIPTPANHAVLKIPSLLPEYPDAGSCHSCSAFTWALGMQTLVLMTRVGEVLYPLNCLPSPSFLFFLKFFFLFTILSHSKVFQLSFCKCKNTYHCLLLRPKTWP